MFRRRIPAAPLALFPLPLMVLGLAVLRKLPIKQLLSRQPAAALDPPFVMGSPQNKLLALANQLRLYRPPPESLGDEDEEEVSAGGKVVSQVGFAESAARDAAVVERFRPKRAAVLVCLFEGEGGDFRVILTKRSSRLSTHSGVAKV